MIRDVATSPNGAMIFACARHLWVKSLPNGKRDPPDRRRRAFRIPASASSADGREAAGLNWSDASQGQILELDFASNTDRILTASRASTTGASSNDSASSTRELPGQLADQQQPQFGRQRFIYVMPAAGARSATAGPEAAIRPSLGRQAHHFPDRRWRWAEAQEHIAIDGSRPRDVFDLKYINFVSIRPGRPVWVAFTELFNAYVAPMPMTGGSIELSKPETNSGQPGQPDRLPTCTGQPTRNQLHWMVGREYHSRDLREAFAPFERTEGTAQAG
ncbi:MAG: hypothetical protein R3F08_00340 [Dokdonella sp.]